MKLSKPMEDALFAVSAADGGPVPSWVKTNTLTALVKRGLAQWGGKVCLLTAEGAAEVLRLRPVPVRDEVKVGAPSLPILTTRSQVQIVNGDGAQSWGATGGRTVIQRPGTVGKLCKVKNSSAGRRAKWRKGR